MSSQPPTATDPRHAGPSHTLKDRVLHEMGVYFLITLYFWVLLASFALYRWITFTSLGIGVEQQGLAIVNALILAKITMVVEAIYKRRQQHDRPLILPVIKHSALLTVILIAFHALEGAVHGLIVHGMATNVLGDLGGGTPIGILSVAILFFTMLLPFCAIQELSRVLGGSTLRRIFFAGRHGMTVRVEFGAPRN
jgi:hypothetical protein